MVGSETENDGQVRIEPDVWLAKILDRAVFKVTVAAQAAPEVIRVTLTDAITRQDKPAFLYVKIASERTNQVEALTAAGFHVVDVNVTFERKAPEQAVWRSDSPVLVHEIVPEEYEAALDIAGSCFVYSRFHLDPHIPNETANRIKREWIQSYIRHQRGERLCVAVAEGKPVGFLAILSATLCSEPCRIIDLIGVEKSAQGRGVGKALVDFFINDSVGQCAVLRVGTQVANIPSIRLYEQCGFRLVETAYVLHAHVRNGQGQR